MIKEQASKKRMRDEPNLDNQNIRFLFLNLRFLAKVGPKIAKFLQNLTNGDQVLDLLYHFPSDVINKSYLPKLDEVLDKEMVIIKVKVDAIKLPSTSRNPIKIECSNSSGNLNLIFFKVFPGYVEKNFKIGSEIIISGKIEKFYYGLQIAHPEYVVASNLINQIPRSEVIYPLSAGINQKFLRGKIIEILDKIPNLPEWIDLNLLKKNNWESWKNSLIKIHNPKNSSDFDPHNLARKRLAYDELLALSLANQISRKKINHEIGRKTIGDNSLQQKLIVALPFQLTTAQEKVLSEIYADMESEKKMLRLLQGDVGSGKTIVAFLAMIKAVEEKKQAAIIVPIALLAEQHFTNFSKLAENLKIKITILTSKTTKKKKAQIIESLQNGEIDIIIGTHALIYPEIIFKNLSLIVIDEQHRFGVLQRLELTKKGIKPDLLLMSATPIPRSLMMTLYGDMDISILDKKPTNRATIDTRVMPIIKIDEIYQGISRALNNGEKIYWICPLIEKSEVEIEDSDISNVTSRYQLFCQKFGKEKVALIHGQMKDAQKDKIMEQFSAINSTIQILVATTVIEVGIDVTDATIMIIENCEKFGLSQLHQLRGRVGRGDKKSYNILLYGKEISALGKARLAIMKESDDGFKIAEEDMKMRGTGQVLGTKQSGFPEYKIANLAFDYDLLAIANRQAQFMLNQDPELINNNGKTAKILLELFNYHECIKLIHGG